MARRGIRLLVAAAALPLGIACAKAQAPPDRVNTIHDVFVRLGACWRPPAVSKARAIDITVIVSFNRNGEILGHPRITYESAEATDNDRVLPVRLYHQLLVYDIMRGPWWTRRTEQLLNPVLGKSLVLYLVKPA